MVRKKKAAVIGSGIGGIAVAIRLAVRGYKVTVFEKNEYAGGKISEFRKNGYRFDMGPSLLTLPELLDELFTIAGKIPEDYFSYEKLEIICKYFYPDGLRINAYQDADRFAGEVQEKLGSDTRVLKRFLKKSETLFKLTSDIFLFQSFYTAGTFFSWRFVRALLNWWRLDVFSTMHRANQRRFKNSRLAQLFDRYATYNGSDPYRAPATLNVISHLEHNTGAYFPSGGMVDIVHSTLKLAAELGIEFKYCSKVEAIHAYKNRIANIIAKGRTFSADIVVSDIDVIESMRMLRGIRFPKSVIKRERSLSAIVFYWGIRNEFNELDLHNIFFSADYREEFRHLFRLKMLYHDPTVYVFISSKKVPGDAPGGCENWFVMINAPANSGQNWDVLLDQARRDCIGKINKALNTSIEEYIEFEEYLDPRKIERQTSSVNGSLYGNSSNSIFAAFRRHPNFSKKVKGLYYVGGSVHPGGGIPLCLASAMITDDMIKKSYLKDVPGKFNIPV